MGNDSSRSLKVIALTFLAGVTAIAAFNVAMNPFGYYPVRFFPPLIDLSREIKSRQMQTVTWAPQIMILGSSRTTELPPGEIERITGKRTYNAACPLSMTEDELAITRFAIERCHWNPEVILVGLDVDAFHPEVPPNIEYAGGARDLRPYLPTELTPSWLTPARALIAWNQMFQSTVTLRYALSAFPEPARTLDDHGWELHLARDAAEILPDGSVHRPPVDVSDDEWNLKYKGFNELMPARVAALRELARYSSERGIRLLVYLTPLYDGILTRVTSETAFSRDHSDVLKLLEELKTSSKLFDYWDYTTASSFGGDPEDFQPDGGHMRRDNLRTLARVLAKDEESTR